ncbi:transglycosylase SLT domain-containing protein [Candidatus Peregrinibacteria bacterium]|nr:transglycosylase SLT domain-containing protein [Candidatus Peregrinibacteria bacterium]
MESERRPTAGKNDGHDPERRGYLLAAVAGIATFFAAKIAEYVPQPQAQKIHDENEDQSEEYKLAQDSPLQFTEGERGVPSGPLSAGELTKWKIEGFQKIFAEIGGLEIVFVDQNGRLIETPKIPMEPHLFPADLKKAFEENGIAFEESDIPEWPVSLSHAGNILEKLPKGQRASAVTEFFVQRTVVKDQKYIPQIPQEIMAIIFEPNSHKFIPRTDEDLNSLMLRHSVARKLQDVIRKLWYKNVPDQEFSQKFLDAYRRHIGEMYPSVHVKTGDEGGVSYPRQYNTLCFLRKYSPDDRAKTFFDVAYENYQKAEIDTAGKYSEKRTKMSRLSWARKIFAEKSQFPEGLQKIIVQGVPLLETGGGENETSPAGARGGWQLVKKTAQRYGLVVAKKNDERTNFLRASEGAAGYFEYLYNILKANKNLQAIQQEFQVPDEDFLYPCVLSGYHVGENIIQKVLQWFRKKYVDDKKNAEKIKQQIVKEEGKGYGRDIYMYMTAVAATTNDDHAEYGSLSSDYAQKAIALSELLEKKENGARLTSDETYAAPRGSVAEEEETPLGIAEDTRACIQGTLTGAVAGSTALIAANLLRHVQQNTLQTKREHLETWGWSAFSTILVRIWSRLSPTVKPDEETSSEIPAETPELFPQGKYIHSDDFGKRLKIDAEQNRFPLPVEKWPGARRYPRRGQPEFLKWLQTSEGRIAQKIENHVELERLIAQKKLIPILEQGKYVRLRDCGGKKAKEEQKGNNNPDMNNHPDYVVTCPQVAKLLREISIDFNEQLHAMGLPEKFSVRIVVGSLTRDAEYQKKVNSSTTNSAHSYGIGVDLAMERFDIINTETGEFYDLAGDPFEANRNSDPQRTLRDVNKSLHDIVGACFQHVLGGVLLEKQKSEDLLFYVHSNHFHFSARDLTSSVSSQDLKGILTEE